MKKLALILTLAGIIAFGQSCSNEFDLVDDWKNIPVVYGLLSRADTAHYIRVEKAFLDPETSAFEIAQIPDSLYYSNIRVELERTATGQKFPLNRVDGNLEGYQREAGVFANSPNYLYKIDSASIDLIENEEYRLLVTDGSSDALLTEAVTKIIGDYESRANQPSNPIGFRYESPVNISWRIKEDDSSAFFYDLRLVIHYREQDINVSNEFVNKEIEWIVEDNIERESNGGNLVPITNVRFSGITFYRFLEENLEVSSSITRQFQYIDIIVNAGGKDLFDYINIGQSNTGITSSQAIPSYTNLSEGIGVFSTRNQAIFPNYFIDTKSADSLRNGIYTRDLNFQ